MENNFYFKHMTVEGNTKEEALNNTPFKAPENCRHDATSAYRNFLKKVGAPSPADMKQFMLDFMKKKKMAPGQLAYITLESAVKDTRKRPYEKTNITRKGARKYGKAFQICEAGTNRVLFETKVTEVVMKDKDGNVLKDKDGNDRMKVSSATKADAEKVVAALYTDKENPIKTDIYIRQTKIDLNGDDIVARYKYTPSKHTQPGKYLVFGMLAVD